MRFTSIIVAGVLAVAASAQSSATPTVSIDTAQSSAAAAITKCLEACPASDVTCQSKCISVPAPSEDQVNKTTKCVADCDQGDGSAEATQKFATCRDNCIAQYYWSSGSPAAATGGSNSGSGSGSSGSNSASATGSATGAAASGSAGESGSPTATGSGAAASGSDAPSNAAPAFVGSASLGLVGLVGALLL
ncbi:hypothetical protein CSOJ01_09449 [Colletotrichum sojae]|uniref:Uncharacterized protein n=1 Tax=Colletotrichum sojae TaxID=2175907 RepID=A0A8H6MQK3_9PEZI|nr:hypothetical protein CSOJ01_09449 [Colletotrichum sojae]